MKQPSINGSRNNVDALSACEFIIYSFLCVLCVLCVFALNNGLFDKNIS
jgi:hypothetical protein